MALTGALVADFASFTQACTGAEVSLKSFETGSHKVETALTKMTDAFSGRRIIQDATLMTEAVDRIGGVSKLTEKELARVKATATEAAAKMTAMGIDVPPGLQRIADATTHIGTAAKGSTTLLSGMATQLAGMFTIGAVVAFGREVLNAGDQIQKMADQTGLSTAEVQKLQYVAGQSGSSIESLVGAVQNLQQRLGDDNTGAAGAMAKLGIHADAFAKLNTYQQMTTLADAVRSIKDPTEQASTAAALFGKSWKEILPAIKTGMKEVGDQAPIMADSTVQSLDRVGDALSRAKGQATAWGGGIVSAIEGAGFAFGDFLSTFNPEHFGVATSEILRLQGALNDPDGLKNALLSIPPAAAAMGESLKPLTLTLEEQTRIETELTAAGGALAATVPAVTAAVTEAAAAEEVYNTGLKITSGVVGELTEKTRELAEAQRKAAEAQANREKGGSKEFNLETEQSRAQLEIDDPILAKFLHLGYSLAQAAQLKLGELYGFTPKIASKGPRVPGFAGGVENFGGGLAMVGERGPELVNLPGGTDVIPLGRGGGITVTVAAGAVVITNPILRDRQALDQIGQIVSDAITQRLAASGHRLGGR